MTLDLFSEKSEKKGKTRKFGVKDKIGYAFGDLGCASFFVFVSSYLLVFYTDILGISAASVGTLFIIARVWDAINDPIMGAIIDRVKPSKYGKFRPYIIRFGSLMLISGLFVFAAIPILPESFKLPYAYVTYILFGMLYTAVNIPYGSLASVMSDDPNERTSLSTFRNLGSLLANVLVMLVVPSIIFNANNEVTASGFFLCALLLASISFVSFIITFRLTRERILHSSSKNTSIIKALQSLLKNRAFIGISLGSFTMMGATLIMLSFNAYLFKDYFKNTSLLPIAGLAGLLASFLIIPFAGIIVKKLGKKESVVVGSLFTAIIYGIMLFIPNLTAMTFIILSFVASLGGGLINTILWALVSDTIDYQEYISGERNEGTVYSYYSLARKLSQAISGGLGAYLLGFIGYQSGVATQTEAVSLSIKNFSLGITAVGYLVTGLIFFFIYNLSKSEIEKVNIALRERKENLQ